MASSPRPNQRFGRSPFPQPAARRRRAGRAALGVELLEDRCVPSAAADVLNKLPLFFEPNAGQTDAQVRYLSRGPGYNLYLTDAGATLSLFQETGQESVLRLGLAGANPK